MKRSRSSQTVAAAFTLIELLVVISILAILVGLAGPAINSLSKSSGLNGAARLLGNMLVTARSDAINLRTLTQLRIVTTTWKPGANDDLTGHFTKMSIWQWNPAPTNAFSQISNWETLPTGIVVEPGGPLPNGPLGSTMTTATVGGYSFLPTTDTYFLNKNASTLTTSPADNNLTYANLNSGSGSTVFDACCVQFDPTGAADYPITVPYVYIVLTEGVVTSSGITYTHPAPVTGYKSNWVEARLTCLTGRMQILRP